MILLVFFAFLAGLVTILSPCILPVLPIILTTSLDGKSIGVSRSLGVVTGFIGSFTLFTLFFSSIVRSIGIPNNILRSVSVITVAFLGLFLVYPRLQMYLDKLFSLLSGGIPRNQNRSGFGGGLIIGISVGILWTPCVGPILASVIALAATGSVTFDSFLITFAYAIGTSVPMFAIIYGGHRVALSLPFLTSRLQSIQKIFGILMILTALGIYFNFDRKFQSYILTKFPAYGAGLTGFEDTDIIHKELNKKSDTTELKINVGKPMFDSTDPKGVRAAEIIPGGVWFNSDPLSLGKLNGKVVIVDFWTYSCINCQRTLPYLKTWYGKYHGMGLEIIGVHSPEFEFEKNEKNVSQAIRDFGIPYPVVQDNNFDTWNAYDNRYWPAKYFIDADGFIRYTHFGEGGYDESEKVIQELLKEQGAKEVTNEIANPQYTVYSQTPETYLGYGRMDNFVSNERIIKDADSYYTVPQKVRDNGVAFQGNWTITQEYAKPGKGASLLINFDSKEVYLVMKPTNIPSRISVFVDGEKKYFGDDSKTGIVTVDADRLYKLITLPSPGRHMLRLEFEDNNAELFAFTFG